MSDYNLTQLTNQSSLQTGDLFYYVRPASGASGDFSVYLKDISGALKGAFGGNSGSLYPNYNPNSYATSGNLFNTGQLLYPTTNPSGFFNNISGILYVDASGNNYPLNNIISDSIVDVKSFGASGDDNHDDTIAIQNALNSTQSTVFFPHGIYKISGNITGTRIGQILQGHSIDTRIKQYLSGANGISYRIGSDSLFPDGPGIYYAGVRNLSFSSVNANAGKGLDIGSGVNDIHDGDQFYLDDVRLTDFSTGIHLKGMGNVFFDSVVITNSSQSGNLGVVIDGGSANSYDWGGISISRYKTGIYVNSSILGATVRFADFGECDTNVALMGDGASMLMLGGNMDSTNNRHLYMNSNNSSAVIINTAHESIASNKPYVEMGSLSQLIAINFQDIISGADNHNAVFLNTSSSVNVSGSQFPGESWHGLPFPAIYDNATPTSSLLNRGTVWHQIGRSGVAGDGILFSRRKSDGLTYQIDALSNSYLLENPSNFSATATFSGNAQTDNGGGVKIVNTLAGGLGDERGALVVAGNVDIGSDTPCTIVARNNGFQDSFMDFATKARDGSNATKCFSVVGPSGSPSGAFVFQNQIAINTPSAPPPVNAVTPAGWIPVIISGSTYKLPVYK